MSSAIFFQLQQLVSQNKKIKGLLRKKQALLSEKYDELVSLQVNKKNINHHLALELESAASAVNITTLYTSSTKSRKITHNINKLQREVHKLEKLIEYLSYTVSSCKVLTKDITSAISTQQIAISDQIKLENWILKQELIVESYLKG